jgi:hypothetical protein
LNEVFYSDTMFATNRSKGNKCAQVFSAKTSSGFIRWNQKLKMQSITDIRRRCRNTGRFNNGRRQKRKQDLTRTSEKVCERAQIEQEKQDHIRKNKMKQKLQSEN